MDAIFLALLDPDQLTQVNADLDPNQYGLISRKRTTVTRKGKVFFGFCFIPVVIKFLFHGELLSIGVRRSNRYGRDVVKGWVWFVTGEVSGLSRERYGVVGRGVWRS